MLLLTSTSDKIQVVTSGAVTTEVHATYVDESSGTITPGRKNTDITTATTTDVVASPGASTNRNVQTLIIRNSHASTSNTISVQHTDGTTVAVVFSVTLAAGEAIQYLDGVGFQVLTIAGAVKTSQNQGTNSIGSSINAVVLGSDAINNNAVANTIADVTGLSFPVTSGKTYWFRFHIPYTAAATTTGSRWSINGPTTTFLCYGSEYSLAATTTTRNANIISYDLPAASNATSAGTTTGNMAVIEGIITPSANGSVIARFASEVASSAITAKAGAVVHYQELL